MSPAPRLETDRLILRGHTMDDLPARMAMTGDATNMAFVGGVQSREENINRILRYAGNWTLFGRGPLLVEEKATGRYVGDVGINDFFRGLGDGFDDQPEALWVLAADAQGKGYAGESMRAAIAWHEATFGKRRLVCIIAPDNTPSIALADRLGFRAFDERPYKDHAVILFERLR